MHKKMMHEKICLSLLAACLAATPALAQNRFMDEAKEKAARRTENAAVREAEHPDTTITATTHQPDAQIPAGSQPPVAPAQPNAEAAPAQPAAPAAAQ
jgi:hypothetical protein